jgi:cyclophilin family peptidyl-prolyl cis-trans isomerase
MFYRLELQGHADTTLVKQVAQRLDTSENSECRLGASHFFARSTMDINQALEALIQSARYDRSENVKMASALALRKIKDQKSLDALKAIALEDPDYRVRINAVRGLQTFSYEESRDVLIKTLDDENVNVGIASSEVIKPSLTFKFKDEILLKARSIKNWRVQANLFESVLSISDSKELSAEIRSFYNESPNQYQKAALLTALGQSPESYEFVRDQLLQSDVPVIKSTAASALVAINRHKNFPTDLKSPFANLYIQAVQTGDPAVIVITGALTDTALGYKALISDPGFLHAAKQKLSLPKDNEALQPLEAAIAYFESKPNPELVVNDFNHPIDWDLVKSIPKDQKAIIKTSKGDIILKLFVEEAPGSVANFIDLIEQNYFDSKFFHRVVPNFVIQAGCNRGDGWGSEDYSIRSEFTARRYTTGSVGMASAGKDTEGTQWFITHSPTPHLDGRYTIFAIVESGMEIVHEIEVGDQILDIELVK